ncbi:MAG: histidine kinase [Flavobacteriales bacterium]|nr:histidine kinase [Flavobacteriales bacterium]
MIESLRADQNRNRALATGIGGILLLGGGIAWFITDRRRRQERFEKESATLETQALRSQMNPHFIFNALNSINAFVQKNDQDSATSYLSKFARVMRLVLENSRHAGSALER